MEIDLSSEIYLDDDIFPRQEYQPITQPKVIFLTGGSGFLGAFVIAELLKLTQANLYCLVRSENPTQGKQRLLNNLNYYGLQIQEINRIYVLVGDLEKPLFGLKKENYDWLAKYVEIIYHCAASVSFMPNYEQLKLINVYGTQQCIRLACEQRIKAVHYISTYAVFNSNNYQKIKCVYEEPLTGNSLGLKRGYGQSKWVAEKICELAKQRGVPVKIYRAGIISGDSETGIQNTSDTMAMTIMATLEMGYALNIDFLMHLTPVNFCSEALVRLSLNSQAQNHIFHLIQEQPLSWQQLLDWLTDEGYVLKRVEPYEWYKQLQKLCYQKKLFLPILALLSMDKKRSFWNDSNIFSLQFDSSFTKKYLHSKYHCPKITNNLLRKYIRPLWKRGTRL